jgi:ADP-dependent NAD(P)H-hydrate dehydratase / NAD(P)H-hydrate epimerase
MGTLPEWCLPLFAAEAMRAIDRWAIEERGVPSQELMERAGTGVARAVEELVPDGPVAVVCGKGNNGGDGRIAARVLREAGREATVIAFDAGVPLEGFAVVVDALLGTGFAGEPRGATADAIDAINAAVDAGVPVVSVDVPSGVEASTGVVCARAVRANVTVTFHAAKIGLWVRPGKTHAGQVRTLDIGIPRGAPIEADTGLVDPSVLALLPRRGADSTKFSSGHVQVAGGSRGLTGAPLMAAHAAMRTGAGYVTACVPASVQATLASGGLPELMTRGLPDEDGSLTAAVVEEVLDGLRRGGVLALGPGLGRTPGAAAFARELALRSPVATVIDADGLNAHAGRLGDLAGREAPTVLTPHAGELGRLLELPSEEIERERLRCVRAAAELSKAVVVLKGDDTLIATPDVSSSSSSFTSSAAPSGAVAVSRGESPALATAGTGDVLTGVIAALLAQGLDPFTAAAAGVHLHAVAGRIAAQRTGAAEGVTATDVIAALPAARGGAGEG